MPSNRTKRIVVLALILTGLAAAAVYGSVLAQTPSQDDLEEGASLYAANCAMCHGPNGEGRVGATIAQDWPSIRPDLQVKVTITNGIEGSVMPAFSTENGGPLSPEQIDKLTLFILSWQTGGAVIPSSPTPVILTPLTEIPGVEGDPTHGSLLYAQNCAVCHGAEGQGRIGATLAQDWPSFRPDLQVKTVIANGIEGSVMPAWSIANGGPLDDAQVNDITAYILTWQSDGSEIEVIPTEAPPQQTWFTGIAGVIALVVLFLAIITAVLLFQRKKPAEE
jgi:mono/diheme cytochrome c family protein